MKNKNAQAVYDFLTTRPEIHDQGNWAAVNGTLPETDEVENFSRKPEKNVCGTTLCAAGAAVLVVEGKKEFRKTVMEFSGPDGYYNDDVWIERGAKALGIAEEDARRMFYTMDEKTVLKMLKALAKGDMSKFNHLANVAEEEGYIG